MTKKAGKTARIAVLGGGNLGLALARGWVAAGRFTPADVTVTRRQPKRLAALAAEGYVVIADNAQAVRDADIIVLAVQPLQLAGVMTVIAPEIDASRHQVISVVSGATLATMRSALGGKVPVVRAMPNTAVVIGESMTCLAADGDVEEALEEAKELFDLVGRTLVINEDMIGPATALCACGVAFFLRTIRAAMQGGIEIGFHPEDAALLAAQTARGASALSLQDGAHPEREIDRVTTPRGCTIAGLNEMEHAGLSSAMIKGIITSANAAAGLYSD